MDARNSRGATALFIACDKGFAQIASLLITKGANLSIPTDAGISPLIVSVQRGRVDLVRLLAARGCDVDHQESATGRTALMFACELGHRTIAEALLMNHASADIEESTAEGKTALMIAVESNHADIIITLHKYGCDINHRSRKSRWTALTMAVVRHNMKAVRTLARLGADYNAPGSDADETPMSFAAANNLSDVMQCFESCGADLHAPATTTSVGGLTPLMIASFFGQRQVAEYIARRSDRRALNAKSSDGRTALMLACAAPHMEIAALLIAMGADPNVPDARGCTALHIACESGCMPIVQLLLSLDSLRSHHCKASASASAASPSSPPSSPSPAVSRNGSVSLSSSFSTLEDILSRSFVSPKSLIHASARARKCDANAVTREMLTPLMLACRGGHVAVVRVLVSCASVDINMATVTAPPALVTAVKSGFHLIVQELCSSPRTNINVRHRSQWTSLMTATDRGDADTVRVLIACGADVNCLSSDGLTALIIAAAKGFTVILRMYVVMKYIVQHHHHDVHVMISVMSYYFCH